MHVRNEASTTVGIFYIYEQDKFRLSSGEHVLWLCNNLGPVLKTCRCFYSFCQGVKNAFLVFDFSKKKDGEKIMKRISNLFFFIYIIYI